MFLLCDSVIFLSEIHPEEVTRGSHRGFPIKMFNALLIIMAGGGEESSELFNNG